MLVASRGQRNHEAELPRSFDWALVDDTHAAVRVMQGGDWTEIEQVHEADVRLEFVPSQLLPRALSFGT